MNQGRFILLLTGFLVVMMTVGNISESCRKHREVAPVPSASASASTSVEEVPACTSTVSCPLPPPRHP